MIEIAKKPMTDPNYEFNFENDDGIWVDELLGEVYGLSMSLKLLKAKIKGYIAPNETIIEVGYGLVTLTDIHKKIVDPSTADR